MKEQGLNKQERVSGSKRIQFLFEKASAINSSRIRLVYVENSSGKTAALFVVPKKKIKLATNRNLIRRRMKEVYRKTKKQHLEELRQLSESSYDFGFLYQSKEVLNYSDIEIEMVSILKKCIFKLKNQRKT